MADIFHVRHGTRLYTVTIPAVSVRESNAPAACDLYAALIRAGAARQLADPTSGAPGGVTEYFLNLNDSRFTESERATLITRINRARPPVTVRFADRSLSSVSSAAGVEDDSGALLPPHWSTEPPAENATAPPANPGETQSVYQLLHGGVITEFTFRTYGRTRAEDEFLRYLQEEVVWERVSTNVYRSLAGYIDPHTRSEINRLANEAAREREFRRVIPIETDWVSQADPTTFVGWDALFRHSRLSAELGGIRDFARHVLALPTSSWGQSYDKQVRHGNPSYRKNAMVALASGYLAARTWLQYKQPITPEFRVKMRYMWEQIGRVMWDEFRFRPSVPCRPTNELAEAYHRLWSRDGFGLIILFERQPDVHVEMWRRLQEEVHLMDNFQMSSDRCFWTYHSLQQEAEPSIPEFRLNPTPRRIFTEDEAS